jgi:hypothetical protein
VSKVDVSKVDAIEAGAGTSESQKTCVGTVVAGAALMKTLLDRRSWTWPAPGLVVRGWCGAVLMAGLRHAAGPGK